MKYFFRMDKKISVFIFGLVIVLLIIFYLIRRDKSNELILPENNQSNTQKMLDTEKPSLLQKLLQSFQADSGSKTTVPVKITIDSDADSVDSTQSSTTQISVTPPLNRTEGNDSLQVQSGIVKIPETQEQLTRASQYSQLKKSTPYLTDYFSINFSYDTARFDVVIADGYQDMFKNWLAKNYSTLDMSMFDVSIVNKM